MQQGLPSFLAKQEPLCSRNNEFNDSEATLTQARQTAAAPAELARACIFLKTTIKEFKAMLASHARSPLELLLWTRKSGTIPLQKRTCDRGGLLWFLVFSFKRLHPIMAVK